MEQLSARIEREALPGVLLDRDIREPLFLFLEETYGKVRILEEKVTGRARADLVMITPELLYGIEIKSDADTDELFERDYNTIGQEIEDYRRSQNRKKKG